MGDRSARARDGGAPMEPHALIPVMVVIAVLLAASAAWALGFELSETKEQLKLDYDLSITDNGTRRVTVNLTIADQGRLKPLDSVELAIPSQDGSGYVDLALDLATRKEGG